MLSASLRKRLPHVHKLALQTFLFFIDMLTCYWQFVLCLPGAFPNRHNVDQLAALAAAKLW